MMSDIGIGLILRYLYHESVRIECEYKRYIDKLNTSELTLNDIYRLVEFRIKIDYFNEIEQRIYDIVRFVEHN